MSYGVWVIGDGVIGDGVIGDGVMGDGENRVVANGNLP